MWVNITNSTITGLANGNYYLLSSSQSSSSITLSTTYKGSAVSYSSAGTATLDTYIPFYKPIGKATEQYIDTNGAIQYRYYVLAHKTSDDHGYVWVYDTGDTTTGLTWAMIDINSVSHPSGIGVYNGWLFVSGRDYLYYKMTSALGVRVSDRAAGWDFMTSPLFQSPTNISVSHPVFVGSQSTMYYGDGNYVGSIFATAGTPNVWTYGNAQFTNGSAYITFYSIGGSTPYVNQPVCFNTSTGNLPAEINLSTIYYIKTVSVSVGTSNTITISATVGGAAISFTSTQASGYMNTFNPYISSTYTLSAQACTLPIQETVQAFSEIGNTLVIGTGSNILYPWDQVSAQPSNLIFLPEADVAAMLTVNNMAYVFAGQKGNVYITNGSTASRVMTVPDYITGRIEPYFTWGDVMYLRGRVWFSVQDQTASYTGYCGGVWSFVPTQNFFLGQDTGLSLRLEHQSSYGTYNGLITVLVPNQNQSGIGAQYWSGWFSSVSSPKYGIDVQSSSPYVAGETFFETDLIPIGSFLQRQNFTSIMTRYSAPLVAGESVQVLYRNDLNASWTSIGTDSTVGSLGTRFNVPFANQMMVQFKVVLTSTATTPSFVRFKELRIKK